MRTESEEWSGSSWMKRSLNMGRKMCMAATRGWRSSGFLYLFYEGGVARDQCSPHVLRSGIRSSAVQTLRPPRPPPTHSFWRAGRGRARCPATRRCCLTAGRSRSCPLWSSTCLGSLPWSCDGCTLSAGPCEHQEGQLRAGWGGEKKIPLVLLGPRQLVWLPDALRWVDDGLHDVVSDELPVLIRDVINGFLCARLVSTTPVLSYHVLEINHTWTEDTRFRSWCKKQTKNINLHDNKRVIMSIVILNGCLPAIGVSDLLHDDEPKPRVWSRKASSSLPMQIILQWPYRTQLGAT